MKIFFFAFLGALIGASFFIPELQTLINQNQEIEVYRNIILTTLFALLFMEGFIVRIQSKNQADQNTTQSPESQIANSENETIKLKDSIKEKEQKIVDLQTAFDDSQKNLQAHKEKAKAADESNQSSDSLSLLTLLQQKGRFLDFIMDDITSYPDPQVGAAARVVHQGCVKVMKEFFDITPVQKSEEGEKVTLTNEDDMPLFKLVGKVKEDLPYTGTLIHKGWMTSKVDLPKATDIKLNQTNSKLITPAELEIH